LYGNGYKERYLGLTKKNWCFFLLLPCLRVEMKNVKTEFVDITTYREEKKNEIFQYILYRTNERSQRVFRNSMPDIFSNVSENQHYRCVRYF